MRFECEHCRGMSIWMVLLPAVDRGNGGKIRDQVILLIKSIFNKVFNNKIGQKTKSTQYTTRKGWFIDIKRTTTSYHRCTKYKLRGENYLSAKEVCEVKCFLSY